LKQVFKSEIEVVNNFDFGFFLTFFEVFFYFFFPSSVKVSDKALSVLMMHTTIVSMTKIIGSQVISLVVKFAKTNPAIKEIPE
jgi:hypothetical protein